ncbi:MAG: type IX secretion system sortase PorU [Flavobacteriales bacterium]
MNKYRIIFVFLSLLNFQTGNTQVTINLNWNQTHNAEWQEKSYVLHYIEGQGIDNGLAFYFEKIKTNSLHQKVVISNEQYEPIPPSDELFFKSTNVLIPSEFNIEASVNDEAGKPFIVIHTIPFRFKNGVYERLVSFTYQVAPELHSKPKDFVQNSVLKSGSGTWYKISVLKDGIYKIDKAFLESCGINTSGLNPAHIHIYGNGDGLLPEKNNIPRTDDLAENAIFVQGESDGVFNDNDYILFYAWGPHRWMNDDASFKYVQKRNLYSDFSTYFININSNVAPLRIQQLAAIENIEDTVISSYDYRDIYENDLVNLLGGGQRWYGELFDVELERTFNFAIPNIDTNRLDIHLEIAANCPNNNMSNTIKTSINNQTIFTSILPINASDYSRGDYVFSMINPPSSIAMKLTVQRQDPTTLTYLDRITLSTKRQLVFYGTQFGFRVKNMTSSQVVKYDISGLPSNGFVWDLSDRHAPKKVFVSTSGNVSSFKSLGDFKEFVASNGSAFFTPDLIGAVSAQNLHGLPQADYLIVSHPDFLAQANRLADLHRAEGLTVHVVNVMQIYNEFSSGMQDAGAIRMFAKMFYDRALQTDPNTMPKYLLLFGDGTYDPKNRKANNNNFIPTYQAITSEDHISALVSDDYYGLLGDLESFSNTDLLDIGIGRFIVSDIVQAKQQVDKVEHYMKNGSNLFSHSSSCCLGESDLNSTFGDWRLKYIQIADNDPSNQFILNNAEPQYDYVTNHHREMNGEKLYMDAFPMVISTGGIRYPALTEAITDRVQRGILMINYVGHGGEKGLAEERIVNIPQIQSWNNINALNLFVSATCEFTRYDDPERVSAGEWAFLNPTGSSIALMTTTRAVFISVNEITGDAFYQEVFTRDANGKPKSFGEIAKVTKNNSGSSGNKRSFTLIGDPALTIALPRYRIVTDSINGLSPTSQIDTIKALSKVRVKGHLEDWNGTVMSAWNGVLTPTIYDKFKTQQTLGQDPPTVISFKQQRSKIYRGKASIVNGYFDFDFIVPKDIALNYGNGKISYYGNSTITDAQGYDTTIIIGGINPNGLNDVVGPEIQLFMNDDAFVSGSVTDASPVLFAKIFDENGVNTVGNGIGHDIVAILDGETSNPYVLNDFYSAELNDYQNGQVHYQFQGLSKGKHTVELKVWDVNNNSGLARIDFIVQEKSEPTLSHVYNYPNPFTTRTSFMFEHNQSCNQLEVQIQIYTVSGKLVKTIQQMVPTQGFRSEGIEWDGKDDFGDQLAKGVYVYRLKVKNLDGLTTEKTEKLVILK